MSDLDWSPDSTWLTYRTDGAFRRIFVAPAAGAGSPVLVSPSALPGRSSLEVSDPEFSPDGRWLFYRADQEVSYRSDLYAVAMSRSGPGARFNLRPSGVPASWAHHFERASAANGSAIAFGYGTALLESALYVADLSGSVPGTPRFLAGDPATGRGIWSARWLRDDFRLLLRGDLDTNDLIEAFVADAFAPELVFDRLHGPLPISGYVYHVIH